MLVQLDLDPLPVAAVDRLFDRFARRTMPRIVDRLVESWSRPAGEAAGGEPSEAYYLPLESNVL